MKKLFILLFALSLLINSCTSSAEYSDRATLETCFNKSFGFLPSTSIKEIKVKNHFVRDSWIFFMKFTYNDSALAEIIKANFRDSVSTEQIDDAHDAAFNEYGSKPDWVEKPGNDAKMYYGKGDTENWPFSSEVLWVDKNKEFIYYISQGVHF